jgi:hypothetical protein
MKQLPAKGGKHFVKFFTNFSPDLFMNAAATANEAFTPSANHARWATGDDCGARK